MTESSHIPVAPGVSLPPDTLRYTFARSSGPGGQNVNKLNTKATLTLELDDLAAHAPRIPLARLRALAGRALVADQSLRFESEEHRSQIANKKACLEKLRHLLILAQQRPKKRKPTRPTKGSVERRLTSKKQRGEIKRLRKDPDS